MVICVYRHIIFGLILTIEYALDPWYYWHYGA